MEEREDEWEAAWAIICLTLGEATAFLTVYPTLYEVPGFSREGLTLGFGLLLSATYFLMGLPCVGALKRGSHWVLRRFRVRRKDRSQES